MSIHRLREITIGVPDVAAVRSFYRDFGLGESESGLLTTTDGGDQLRLVPAPRRRLLSISLGVDDRDDLARVDRQLTALGAEHRAEPDRLTVLDPGTGVEVELRICPRVTPAPGYELPALNYPDAPQRFNSRAAGVLREAPVRPRKLGHVVVGSTDQDRSYELFTKGIGFKVSDEVPGEAAFMRCTTDHHNLLVQRAPIQFLHHTSWQVDDVEEVGRGATTMLEADPSRHMWGLGRHHIGSNFFWYLRDPAGNFAEYYSDMDCIVDDELWQPGVFSGRKSLYAWGQAPPEKFLRPEDLAELMVGAHQPAR